MTKTIDIGLEGAQVQVVELEKELLVLRLAFGKLKAAVADAAAPLGAVLVPALTRAVNWTSRLVRSIGKAIAALLGVTVVERDIQTGAEAAGSAVKRSLAGFDQLDRLNGTGSGTVAATATETVSVVVAGEISPQLQAVIDKLRTLLAPLAAIDLTKLNASLGQLGAVFSTVAAQLGTALEWIWYTLLAPFAAWVLEHLAPALADTLTGALSLLCTALTPVSQAFGGLWQAIEPVISYMGSTVLWVLEQLQLRFGEVSGVIREKGSTISAIFTNIGQTVSAVWAMAEPVFARWKQTVTEVGDRIGSLTGGIMDGLYGVTEFLAGAFSGDWDRAWKGICQYMKNSVNTVIGFLNAMLACAVGAVNGIISALNKLSFTVPDWVPGLGGESLGFQLKAVAVPQIPYLARGAVLPANSPFLAVVGDQKHGTNVEAPLATIQEAVALVMNEQLSALMAGFEATVSELRQLHDTVSTIQVGDTVIGKAAQRYNRRTAVARGGQF